MDNKLVRKASCGNEKKSDCLITVAPADSLKIEIDSKVQKLFGKAIENSIKEVLEKENLKDVSVFVKDLGSLDWAIRARLECALQRAREKA